MKCSIIGLGTALPPESVSQEDAMAMSAEVICENDKQKRILQTLFRKAGVKSRRTAIPWRYGYDWKRSAESTSPCATAVDGPSTAERMALYQQYASPLAISSSAAAIESSGLTAQEITHLVTVSCTGFAAPGVDIDLIDSLGLPRTTQRVHVGYMGCHGSINGLRTVRGLTAADPDARVLMCSVELCSLHYRMRWDEEGIIGNALFADGSAALIAVGSASESRAICDVKATGSCLVADTTDEMSWQIGDNGFQMRLTGKVPECIRGHLRPWLSEWLSQHDLSIQEIDQWIIHPGGPKIIDAAESSLGLTAAHTRVSRDILEQFGNMSSATVLFILEKIADSIGPGPVVILAFGPGVMVEAALLGG